MSSPPLDVRERSRAPAAPNPTTHPISLDALLAQHASAPNPHLAALDQALSERNIFSAQNTQLWKLIEKQRSAYNHVLKELERMRTERDTFKTRLQAAGLSVEFAKKDKDKDKPKPLRPSASNLAISSSSENGPFDPRETMVRHVSDTPGLSRHFSPASCNPSFAKMTAPGSRNDDRPATPPQSHDENDQLPYLDRSSNISMPPAIAPPRSASLPRTNSNQSPSSPLLSSRSNDADRAYARATTSVSNNASPMPHPTSSQQSTIPSASPTDANGLSGSRSPVCLTSNTVLSPQPSSLYSASVPAHITHSPSLTSHSSSSLGTGLLSPIPENSKPINRSSNVSLPDEARRYIANMGESPLQSPGTTTAVTTSRPDQAQTGQRTNIGRNPGPLGAHDGDETEFLDMDEEEDGVDEIELQHSSAINNDKPANSDDFPTPPSHSPAQIHRSSHTHSDPSQPMPRPGSQLPPASEVAVASQTRWQSQSDSSVLSHSQSSMESASMTSQPDSPSLESYLSPTKSTHGTTANGPNPTFRALPLIADDLKTTRATVSHSSIRPNDRGKEVLSFEIEVDPGKGKEPWKVEKLYSDVLGLDHRLKAVVGKGVSKKIATLPEGKLWRDHAPAKSDQRKVS